MTPEGSRKIQIGLRNCVCLVVNQLAELRSKGQCAKCNFRLYQIGTYILYLLVFMYFYRVDYGTSQWYKFFLNNTDFHFGLG